jgi:hypothetical protein
MSENERRILGLEELEGGIVYVKFQNSKSLLVRQSQRLRISAFETKWLAYHLLD